MNPREIQSLEEFQINLDQSKLTCMTPRTINQPKGIHNSTKIAKPTYLNFKSTLKIPTKVEKLRPIYS